MPYDRVVPFCRPTFGVAGIDHRALDGAAAGLTKPSLRGIFGMSAIVGKAGHRHLGGRVGQRHGRVAVGTELIADRAHRRRREQRAQLARSLIPWTISTLAANFGLNVPPKSL